MKRKGFTLVELLVVIAIIALLMGILMPALAKVRQIANQMMCGTNLSGVGKAYLIYAQENDDAYPRAGGPRSVWGTSGFITQWDAYRPTDAFGGTSGCDATITSSFYLLIRYADMTPKQFVCGGDTRAKAFTLTEYANDTLIRTVEEAWDFGDQPALYCSYSMHMPYAIAVGHPINASTEPGAPLCADRNPYLDSDAASYVLGAPGITLPSWNPTDGYVDIDKAGSSAAHERNGQNVLFNDQHVAFEKYPNCGINNDNIWNFWPSATPDQQQKELGDLSTTMPSSVGDGSQSQAPADAYMVNEDQRVIGRGPST